MLIANSIYFAKKENFTIDKICKNIFNHDILI
jgi:hypothetical protein